MSFVEGEVRRLLSGHVESWETVMTGEGLNMVCILLHVDVMNS